MRFRFMGLPVRRLPYLFAQPYTGAPTADTEHPSAGPAKPAEVVTKNRGAQTQPDQPGVS